MIKNVNEYCELTQGFQKELHETKKHIYNSFPQSSVCVELDKPNYIYTDQKEGFFCEDCGDYYKTYFGQGAEFPLKKVGLAWVTDSDTIFFYERPFRNKALSILKQLLPNSIVEFDNNDIMINGKKVGPSLRTGWQPRECDANYIQGIIPGGQVYCLRWSNLDALNKIFEGNSHHEDRLLNKAGLATLSDFLTISKNEFIKLLEN